MLDLLIVDFKTASKFEKKSVWNGANTFPVNTFNLWIFLPFLCCFSFHWVTICFFFSRTSLLLFLFLFWFPFQFFLQHTNTYIYIVYWLNIYSNNNTSSFISKDKCVQSFFSVSIFILIFRRFWMETVVQINIWNSHKMMREDCW